MTALIKVGCGVPTMPSLAAGPRPYAKAWLLAEACGGERPRPPWPPDMGATGAVFASDPAAVWNLIRFAGPGAVERNHLPVRDYRYPHLEP
ncbi:hypothetical protein [Nonomuraea sp. NPDC049141]|uniref:hypothetical protein n=1 Tax=unclassified Nonomuraea TaxID=2593643 RepID=UPI0033DA990D